MASYFDFKQYLPKLHNSPKVRLSNKTRTEIKELAYLTIYSCPSREGPNISNKFKDYGYCYPVDYSKLIKRIKKSLNMSESDYFYFKKADEYLDKIGDFEKLLKGKLKPFILFMPRNGEEGQLDTLYLKLRHAFAHGNFAYYKKHYIIWNEGKKMPTCLMILSFDDIKNIYSCLQIPDK